jgi:hypothetical protein
MPTPQKLKHIEKTNNGIAVLEINRPYIYHRTSHAILVETVTAAAIPVMVPTGSMYCY